MARPITTSLLQRLRGHHDRYPRASLVVAAFCLLLIGAIWMMATERVNFEREEAITNATRENANLVMAFEEQTIRTFRAAEQVARFVRHEYAVRGRALDLPGFIRSGVIRETIFTVISVVDERGDIRLSTLRTGPVNYADRDYFRFHQKQINDGLFISRPVLGRISGTWQIPMAMRIDRTDESFGGVVVLSVDPAYFTGFYQRADLGHAGAVSLAGLDGTVLARRVGRANSYGENVADSLTFQERARNPVGSFVGTDGLDDVHRVYAYRTLRDYPLLAMVGTALDEVLAPIERRARAYYAASALISALIAAFGLFLTTLLARQRQAEERIRHIAHHDALTQLPNRVLFYDRLDRALLQARRRKKAVGLLFVDLDGFKTVNDTLGHGRGDALLQQIAARLRRCVRAEDTVGRLGGDEFAVILAEIADRDDCGGVARKIVAALEEPCRLDGHEARISGSVGIATWPRDADDADTLVNRADAAMFAAKSAGRGSYRFHAAGAGQA